MSIKKNMQNYIIRKYRVEYSNNNDYRLRHQLYFIYQYLVTFSDGLFSLIYLIEQHLIGQWTGKLILSKVSFKSLSSVKDFFP